MSISVCGEYFRKLLKVDTAVRQKISEFGCMMLSGVVLQSKHALLNRVLERHAAEMNRFGKCEEDRALFLFSGDNDFSVMTNTP